jgi:hypothetical protein
MSLDAEFGFLSYWYRKMQITDTIAMYSLVNSNSSVPIYVGHEFVGDVKLHFTLSDSSGSNWLDGIGTTSLPNDNDWHHVMVSWDTLSGILQYTVDGQLGTIELIQNGTFQITYSDDSLQLICNTISDEIASVQLAEYFFVLLDSFVDLTDQDTVALFISTGIYANDLGADGAAPFGFDGRPHIYFYGEQGFFLKNTPYDSFKMFERTPASPSREFATSGSITLTSVSGNPFPPEDSIPVIASLSTGFGFGVGL